MDGLFQTLLGAVLGIITTVVYENYKTKKQNEQRFAEICRLFQFNADRLSQMIGQLVQNDPHYDTLPDYTLDTVVLDALLSYGPESFKNQKQFKDFNHRRYQLHHINNELQLLFFIRDPSYKAKVLAHIRGELEGVNKLLHCY